MAVPDSPDTMCSNEADSELSFDSEYSEDVLIEEKEAERDLSHASLAKSSTFVRGMRKLFYTPMTCLLVQNGKRNMTRKYR